MSKFLVGNLYLLIFMVLSSASQVLLKDLIDQAPPFQLSWDWLRSFAAGPALARCFAAVAMMGVGFVCWLLCLTRLSLSYAYPIACASVFLVTLFSLLFLDETITPRIWAGTALIVVGIVLLIPHD